MLPSGSMMSNKVIALKKIFIAEENATKLV
jgi:hypothetical protein